MENQEQKTPKSKRLKMVIILLAVLLGLSVCGLAGRYIYLHFFAPARATVTVPDNLIGEESSSAPEGTGTESSSPTASGGTGGVSSRPAGTGNPTAVRLELYEGKPGDNQRFEARNMLPGDTETRYFCVKASHAKDLDVFFRADVTEQTKSLGDVLHIKVTHLETGKVLCDAPFNEITGKEFSERLKANSEKATTAYYRIDVSLDTAVGNEYQAALLRADFHWYVKDEGGLTPPPTGDITNMALWILLAASSLLIILLLAFRRRKEARHA